METFDIKKKIKFVWTFLPEIVFSLVGIIGIIDFAIALFRHNLKTASFVVLSISCVVITCMVGQILWKKFWLAWLLSIPLGFTSFYFLLAVLSDALKLIRINDDRWESFIYAFLIFGSLFLLSAIMPIKYYRNSVGRGD